MVREKAKNVEQDSGSEESSEEESMTPVEKIGIETSSYSSKAHNESESPSSETEDSAPKPAAPQKSGSADGKVILKESESPSKVAGKRTTERMETKEGKKAKVEVHQFTRIWSLEDVIILLNEMVEYGEKNKLEPNLLDLNHYRDQFHKFMMGKLHFDVSISQLQGKIRKLKKRYMRKELKGYTPAFSKPDEEEAHGLSKKIWGKTSVVEKKPNVKSEEDVNMLNGDTDSKKWLRLAVKEIELFDQKLALMSARAKRVIKGLKSKTV